MFSNTFFCISILYSHVQETDLDHIHIWLQFILKHSYSVIIQLKNELLINMNQC